MLQVVTEGGESEFSQPIVVETQFEQTEMGALRDEVFGAINEVSKNLKNEVRYCAIKSNTNNEGTITYDKLFADINTIDTNTWMNVAEGTFTAGQAGTFRVHLGLQMAWQRDEHHTITVMINDEEFAVAIENSGIADDTSEYASWESLVRLEAADILTIRHHSESSLGLTAITWCVSVN